VGVPVKLLSNSQHIHSKDRFDLTSIFQNCLLISGHCEKQLQSTCKMELPSTRLSTYPELPALLFPSKIPIIVTDHTAAATKTSASPVGIVVQGFYKIGVRVELLKCNFDACFNPAPARGPSHAKNALQTGRVSEQLD